ncbi:MAG: hypothetical protein RLZZ299_1364, partial [Pseudomonadota bacterium]
MPRPSLSSRPLVVLLACLGPMVAEAAPDAPPSAAAVPASTAPRRFPTPVVELAVPSGVTAGDPAPVTLSVVAVDADGMPMAGWKARAKVDLGEVSEPREVGGGVYTVAWTPGNSAGTARISWRMTRDRDAIERTWTVPVAARAPRALVVSAQPARVTLRQDAQVSVVFQLKDGDVAAPGADLAVRVSSGEVQNLAHLGEGRFNAMLVPPDVPFPHLSLLTAADRRDPTRAYGALALPMVGKVNFPLRATPKALVMLRIGGRDFGPVAADAEGRVQVPIEVAPGAGSATMVQVLPDGTRRESPIDLKVPETRRIALFPMPALPGEARVKVPVRVFVAQPDGTPDEAAQVTFSASSGSVGPAMPIGGGVYEALFTAPNAVAASEVTLTAAIADKPAQVDTVTVPLLPARATKVTLRAEPATLPASGTSVKVYVKATGSTGAATAGELGLGGRTLRFQASNATLREVKDLRNGDYTATFDVTGNRDVELVGVVSAADGQNPLAEILVLPGAPRMAPDGASSMPLTVVSLDALGYPVGNVPVTLRVSGDASTTTSLTTGPDGVGHVQLRAGTTPGWITVEASRGTLRGTGHAWQAPADFPLPAVPTSGDDAVRARLRDWSGALPTLRIPREGAPSDASSGPMVASVAAARTSRLALRAEPASAVAGGQVTLLLELRDEAGRGVPGQAFELMSNGGTSSALEDLGGGTYRTRFTVSARTTKDVKITAATADGSQVALLVLPLGGGDDAWGANPFAGATPLQGSAASGATQAETAAAPAEGPRTPPWLRLGASGSFATYTYDQQPLRAWSSLYPYEVGLDAAALGAEVFTRLDVPAVPWLGLDASWGAQRYGIDPKPLCARIERPCERLGTVHDWIYDARVLARMQWRFGPDRARFSLGARGGWSRSDIQAYELGNDSIDLSELPVHALAVGPSVTADVGWMFLETGFLEHFA